MTAELAYRPLVKLITGESWKGAPGASRKPIMIHAQCLRIADNASFRLLLIFIFS